MRFWRLIQLVAGGGMLVVVGAAALMLWPLLWPPDPDASVQVVNGRLIGEATGYVGRIDREARTVDVSASLVGWRPVVVIVNEWTAITVQNRQGGFGDLWKDMPVRVSYELVGDARLARSIEVMTADGEPPRPVVNGVVAPLVKESPGASAPPAAAVPSAHVAPSARTGGLPPAAAVPSADVAPAAPTGSPAPPEARGLDPAPARPAPKPVPAADSSRLPSPSPEKPSSASVTPAPRAEPTPVEGSRRVESPASARPRSEPAAAGAVPGPRPGETEGDAAAVIDWLLRERSAR